MELLVDTSVLFAHFYPEPTSAKVDKILAGAQRRLISSLALTEFACALRRRRHENAITLGMQQEIHAELHASLRAGQFLRLPLEDRLAEFAEDLVIHSKDNLRTLDALHLATARMHALPLCTADRRLRDAAKAIGVKTIWVE
jgi:predicted nucleic acid-binding protein